MSSGVQSFGSRGARRTSFRAAVGRHVGLRQSVGVDHSKGLTDQQDGRRSMRMSSRLGKRRRFGGGRGLFRGHGGRKRPRNVDARLSIEQTSDKNPFSERPEEEKASCSTQRVSAIALDSSPVTQNQNGTKDVNVNATGEKRIGKKRTRRAPKRKWKPYFKLTCEERHELEEREERRAERIRELRFKSGLPVAPYNTTQFLLNDLQQRGGNGQSTDDVDTIVENIRHRRHKRSEDSAVGVVESTSIDDSTRPVPADQSNVGGGPMAPAESLGASSSTDEQDDDDAETMENVAAEFEHDYDAAFVERLSGLGRDQLIAEYLQLEKQYERATRDAETLRAEVARLRRRLQQQQQQAKT